jgi:hypothetical protein
MVGVEGEMRQMKSGKEPAPKTALKAPHILTKTIMQQQFENALFVLVF